ncbi:kinase-like protein [Rickenella mellea]|uniref:Kinase-like protein n=1 Tax=Rickenella mellea TaxID=50990 RepID=A0A4Y7QND3_9AGAM|nr:kinase-like protein [Rickenella mellea]
MSAIPVRTAKLSGTQKFIGAVKDEWQLFSDNPKDYTIGLPIGFGASSIVYAATWKPPGKPPSPCALKVLDLDALAPQLLRLLMRETQLMSLSKHPNVLRVRGSWMEGHKLYIALRLMNSGSACDVMRYGWPGGMEEEVVKCILKQALEGLSYLHVNGFIHRDIKAANLLVDDDGTVLLGDLGVAASLSDEGATSPQAGSRRAVAVDAGVDPNRNAMLRPRVRKRKSFVGTPCWMAPELISGKHYDSKADIWSFGITAIELTQGRAPRSRETSATVLMKTVNEAPPLFDRQGGQYKYSKAFKEVVESCLAKDPALRPTAAQLLETPFFKSAKKPSFLVGAVLKGLPPLVARQERRRQPSNRSATRTLDSWDFTTSNPVSPVHSVYRRPHSQAHHDESIFELEDIEDSLASESKAQESHHASGLPGSDDEYSSESPDATDGEVASESTPTTPGLTPSLPPTSMGPISCSPLTLHAGVPSRSTPRPVDPSKTTGNNNGLHTFPTLPVPQGKNPPMASENGLLRPTSSPKSAGGVWKKLARSGKGDDTVKEKERGKPKPLVERLWDKTVGAVEEAKTATLERVQSRGSGGDSQRRK